MADYLLRYYFVEHYMLEGVAIVSYRTHYRHTDSIYPLCRWWRCDRMWMIAKTRQC